MEPFLRRRLACLSPLWDRIWPAGAPGGAVPRWPGPGRAAGLERAAPAPPGAPPGSPPGPGRLVRALCDFSARCVDELSVRRGDRLCALREEGDYTFARRLSGPPSVGLVPTACVAGATPDPLSDQP